jgi:hypothetical protein
MRAVSQMIRLWKNGHNRRFGSKSLCETGLQTANLSNFRVFGGFRRDFLARGSVAFTGDIKGLITSLRIPANGTCR